MAMASAAGLAAGWLMSSERAGPSEESVRHFQCHRRLSLQTGRYSPSGRRFHAAAAQILRRLKIIYSDGV